MRRLELLIPPPLVALLAGALMWLVARALPGWQLDIPSAGWIAAFFGAFGLSFDVAGIVSFHRARTTVNPMRPHKATALVTSGIYRWTRNPMYLGWIPILAGWAIYLEHPVTLLVIPLFVAYLNRFQIGPEERALSAAFGEEYRNYLSRVRRWI